MAEPRFELTTVGETMLRLSVPAGARLQTAERLDLAVGGAESNVAAALARLGRRTAWVSALPDTPLGRRVVEPIRAAGVDASSVIWRPDGRVGAYFAEFAAPPRAIEVYYDRAGSCAAALQPTELPWELLLDTRLLHLSGILPALSDSCREAAQALVERAALAGVPVSLDVNYRARLWTAAQARAALLPLMAGADLLFCARRDAALVFGVEGESAAQVARGLAELSGARAVVVSDGAQGVAAWDGAAALGEPALPAQVVDRFGAGDALAAGVIHGWLAGSLQRGLRYGVALAALALAQHGDMLVTTRDEVERLLQSAGATLRR